MRAVFRHLLRSELRNQQSLVRWQILGDPGRGVKIEDFVRGLRDFFYLNYIAKVARFNDRNLHAFVSYGLTIS
jgi:hypothetical protein